MGSDDNVITLHLLMRCLLIVVFGRLVCLVVAASPAPKVKLRTLATIRQSLVLFLEQTRCALARAMVRLIAFLAENSGYAQTWLILPVVICLSQRLSHACLSISFYTAKLRMAH